MSDTPQQLTGYCKNCGMWWPHCDCELYGRHFEDAGETTNEPNP